MEEDKNSVATESPFPSSGFSFENCARNLALEKLGLTAPKLLKTGTTIVGVTFKGGVVIGADSRSTAGNVVADKHCEKVARLSETIYAAGAGTSADLHQVTRMLESHLSLVELNSGRRPTVVVAVRKARQHLFRYQGHVGAYLLIGGVDYKGAHLYRIAAHGSSSKLPYAADGSGSYAASPLIERGFKADMTEAEARKLVAEALQAGMHGDLCSGNFYHFAVITPERTTLEQFEAPAFSIKPEPNQLKYDHKAGTTKVLREKEIKFEVVESMDVDKA